MQAARYPISALLLIAAACSTYPEEAAPLTAPDVTFRKAVVLAAVNPENRKAVENFVAAEIEKRRPGVDVIPTWELYPSISSISAHNFQAYLDTHAIDIVITIAPFAEIDMASYDSWTDVASDGLDDYYERLQTVAIAGRIGVQVVAWNAKTWKPLYSRTSSIMAGEVVGPQGVAEFASESVTQSN